MRVLLLSYEYPPETGFGGIGTYTWYHARALARLGHEVHVLAGATEGTPLRTNEHDGVTVFRYRASGPVMRRAWDLLGRAQLWWTRIRLDNAVSMHQGLRMLLRQGRYDIAEMPECGAEGSLINTVSRVSTIVRFHSPAQLIMPFYDARRLDHVLCSFVERRGIAGARAFSSCSQFLAQEVRSVLRVRRPVPVVPNGIDLDLFDARPTNRFRSRFGISESRPMVFFAGRMERRKGIHLCREIAASVLERHDVTFVMAGQDLFDIVAREIQPYLADRALKGEFRYVGRLDLDGVRAGVSESDIFLLPSLWENCPYSCLEAMAAGRAIISTDQGGMPELIEHEVNGLLARSGDAAAYVSAIDRLLADDALRRALGHAARETVEARFRDVHTAARAAAQYVEHAGG